MLVTEVTNALPGGSSLLRNEPVQARSSARLAGLLDAAAAVIDEIGFERLTTAMVAERAGASIGTVYRYFPDRIAVVEALAIRCTQRLPARFVEALDASGADDLAGRVRRAHRHDAPRCTAPSPASGPSASVTRRTPVPVTPRTAWAHSAATVGQIMRDRFGMPDDERITRAWVVLAESGHAVLARAHRDREHPDTALIEEYRRMNRAHLESVIAAS